MCGTLGWSSMESLDCMGVAWCGALRCNNNTSRCRQTNVYMLADGEVGDVWVCYGLLHMAASFCSALLLAALQCIGPKCSSSVGCSCLRMVCDL